METLPSRGRRSGSAPPAHWPARARPPSGPPSPVAEPPSGARRPGHRRAPALPPPAPGGGPRDGKRRRRGRQPRSRGRSGRRGPRPRAARDCCAALVRGEGRPGEPRGCATGPGERPRRCSGAGAGGCLHDWASCAAGARRAGWGNLGCSPARGHCVPCDLGVCQCKAEENPRDLALELAFLGREREIRIRKDCVGAPPPFGCKGWDACWN